MDLVNRLRACTVGLTATAAFLGFTALACDDDRQNSVPSPTISTTFPSTATYSSTAVPRVNPEDPGFTPVPASTAKRISQTIPPTPLAPTPHPTKTPTPSIISTPTETTPPPTPHPTKTPTLINIPTETTPPPTPHPTKTPTPSIISTPTETTPPPQTNTPTPILGLARYQERLTAANYPVEMIERMTSWQDNTTNRRFIDELLFMSKNGIDAQRITQIAQPFLPGEITLDELTRWLDIDNDNLSNKFEIQHNNTDPLTPNERYAIIMNTAEDGKRHTPDEDSKFYEIKKFLVLNYNWKPENIEFLPFILPHKDATKDATYINFARVIENIAQKSTENDDVYIMWASHGGEGYMIFQCSYLAGGKQDCDQRTYEEIDSLVDQIKNARVVTLLHDASEAQSMHQYVIEGRTPRIISYNGPKRLRLQNGEWDSPYTFAGIRNFGASMSSLLLELGRNPNYLADKQPLSLQEFLRLGAPAEGSVDFDSHNLADEVYLGELNQIGWNQFRDMEITN